VKRAALMRALRANAVAAGALIGVVLLASLVGGYILANQRLNPPAWVPVVGESFYKLRVELDTGQGILPGQGQAVNVSGVRVGDIASVDLVDGKAVATLNIEEKYGERVYPDATLLLRPKTGLKDMVLELDPGTPESGKALESGTLVENSSTQPDVNVADFLASLDGDTRDYLKLLLAGGGQALGDGGGRDLANTFRRFAPLSRDAAKASRLVAQRRVKLRRVISNFSKIATTLGEHDQQLARFVNASSSVFGRFANQNQNLGSTIELLPAALRSGNQALAKVTRLGNVAAPTLTELQPAVKSLGPALEELQPFFRNTVAPIRDQLRPFSREARPTAKALVPATRDFADSTSELHKFTNVLNAVVNELAYDPPGKGVGKEGYLFFAPWAAHNTNSMVAQQDGVGPLRRGVVFIGCSQLNLLDSIARGGRNPQLTTLVTLLNVPNGAQAGCPASGDGG
jgi:phospholipid/cholesterol/gamma-HCH transport system substrate-binding protein